MPPLVSILIPAYNHGNYLPDALRSAQTQRVDKEILVIDDGSTDQTADILATQPAGQVLWRTQPNAGQSVTRNRLWREAKGEFIAFLDDDDWWPEEKLAWQVDALRSDPEAVMVFGNADLHSEDGVSTQSLPWPAPTTRAEWRRRLLVENPIRSPGQTLIRRSALEQAGGFDESLRGPDDWDLYLKLTQFGAFRYVDRPALNYRVHEANASSTQWLRMHEGSARVIRKHTGRFPVPGRFLAWFHARARLRESLGIAAGAHHLHLAWEKQRAGQRRESRGDCFRALQANPALLTRLDWWRKLKGSIL